MGLLREDGTPKLALRAFRASTRPRWASASGFISRITGSTTPCAGCSGSASSICARDCPGPTASARTRSTGSTARCEALADFEVTVTFCFTPEHRGIAPHHTSPPRRPEEFAEFCAAMMRRYAPAKPASAQRPVMVAN